MIKKISFTVIIILFIFNYANAQRFKKNSEKVDDISSDSIVRRTERIYSTLSKINSITKKGYDTRDIEVEMANIQVNLQNIRDNLSLYKDVLNVKSLEMFQVLLSDIQYDLDKFRLSLSVYNRDLVMMQKEVKSFVADSIPHVLASDSSYVNLYIDELKDLNDKRIQANKLITGNAFKINKLSSSVSKSYFDALELQDMVNDLLKKYSKKDFTNEYNYIWSKPKNVDENETSFSLAKKTFDGQRKILNYYLDRSWTDWFIIIAIGALFFWWVNKNFKQINKTKDAWLNASIQMEYLKTFPFLATLILIFILAPFFDLDSPSVYIDIIYILLLIVLTILFGKLWPKQLFMYWLAIAALFFIVYFTNISLIPNLSGRLWLITLNGISIFFGYHFLKKVKISLPLFSFINFVLLIFIGLNAVAIILNSFGRVSLAKVFTTSAIFCLTQVIALSVFYQILVESIYLQVRSNHLAGEIAAKANFEKVQKGINPIFKFLVIMLWVMVLAANLNIYNYLYKFIYQFFTTRKTIGNTAFTYGNILIFGAIIYLSNFLQKYIGYFFGETDDEFISASKASKLILLRLVLLLIGFTLAILASGVQLDKITIVIGALGVGIGLGLQNIVTNLVSGFILVFERPFHIGDFIEVGAQKGRVRNIGMRSTKLITNEGAEIIVPNGDLLSGHVVNWTLSNNHVRMEQPIKVGAEYLQQAKDLILQELKNNANVLHESDPEILIESITENVIELNIICWIINIHNSQSIKSEILNNIYQLFKTNNVKLG